MGGFTLKLRLLIGGGLGATCKSFVFSEDPIAPNTHWLLIQNNFPSRGLGDVLVVKSKARNVGVCHVENATRLPHWYLHKSDSGIPPMEIGGLLRSDLQETAAFLQSPRWQSGDG